MHILRLIQVDKWEKDGLISLMVRGNMLDLWMVKRNLKTSKEKDQ